MSGFVGYETAGPFFLWYNMKKMNTMIIKSGGGTGPMKPGNRRDRIGAKSCRPERSER